jgi:RNA polymerase sigma-70 factor (ECF subfamily)
MFGAVQDCPIFRKQHSNPDQDVAERPVLGPAQSGHAQKGVRIPGLRLPIETMSRNPAHESRFKAWLETHRGILFKVTRSFAHSQTEEADLLQELQLQLWNSVSTFSGRSKESTWVYKVCLNTALAWRRSFNRRNGRIEPGIDLAQVAAQSASPAEKAGSQEILEKLYASIHRMDDFDRALVLLMLDGQSYREISEVTGLSENHVGVALARARQRLSKLMKGVADELR